MAHRQPWDPITSTQPAGRDRQLLSHRQRRPRRQSHQQQSHLQRNLPLQSHRPPPLLLPLRQHPSHCPPAVTQTLLPITASKTTTTARTHRSTQASSIPRQAHSVVLATLSPLEAHHTPTSTPIPTVPTSLRPSSGPTTNPAASRRSHINW